MLVAQGKAARPQPWDESRVIEGAPQGVCFRGTPRPGAQRGDGGAGEDYESERECVRERRMRTGYVSERASAAEYEKVGRAVAARICHGVHAAQHHPLS